MGNEGNYQHGMLGSTGNNRIKYKLESSPRSTRHAPGNKIAATDQTQSLEIKARRNLKVTMININLKKHLVIKKFRSKRRNNLGI